MGKRFLHQLLVVVLALFVSPARSDDWLPATATFYGGADGSDTMGGACGYGDLYEQGYGVNNAALSTALFNDGASCGQCYVIRCDSSKTGWCKPGTSNFIVVSATNFCPPNWELPNGGWCGPPRPHFDMSQPAWENIGIYNAGIIPVLYQRVKCWRSGGVRFTIAGFDHFYMVLITNVAGSGSIQSMAVKGANTDWIPMYRNWGANWHCLAGGLVDQGLSFALVSTGGQNIVFQNVVPAWWQFGQTFTTYQNFDY
ncbi:expansin-A19 [Zea mays]|uniref:Expansin n=1 Tax=Zea mays TaxID=4577 RepID=A0A1D6LEI4_MAIZE|nr:expansin-A19 [Zea mays]AQK78358.1 Expansin-A11 [Zea mays]|eukprot:XP_008648414.1 expansin-A19 [Zea mays]